MSTQFLGIMRSTSGFLLALLLTAMVRAQTQTPIMSGGTGFVSPSVVGTSIFRKGSADDAELELLVLWRAAPGWFMKGGHASAAAGMMHGSPAGVYTSEASYGDVHLQLEFDRATRIARVQGVDLRLADHNVILVDSVDTATPVMTTLRVNASVEGLPGRPVHAIDVIKSSPALVAYLRCDLTLPDMPRQVQQMMMLQCNEAGATR